MMKITLGFIAFILTFGFSTALVGVLFGFPQTSDARYLTATTAMSPSVARRIERLLKRDVNNGLPRNRAKRAYYDEWEKHNPLEMNPEYSSAFYNYVKRSASMSDAGLPRDFQYAWRTHMKTWKKESARIREINDMGFDELTDSAKSFPIQQANNTREINATWDQVLRIAQRYGVKIDRSYYR